MYYLFLALIVSARANKEGVHNDKQSPRKQMKKRSRTRGELLLEVGLVLS